MPSNETNAIELLKHDHREVEGLFSQFEGEDAAEKKVELARKICTELAIHARIEEELFYPAAREELSADEQPMVAEAAVEHASLKRLIEDIDGTGPDDPLFDARMTVLQEYVKHHVKEEEQELMPAVEKAGEVDLDELGRQLAERKQQLKDKLREPASDATMRKVKLAKLPAAAARSRTSPDGTARRASAQEGKRASSSAAARARKSAGTKTTKATKSASGAGKSTATSKHSSTTGRSTAGHPAHR